MTAKGRETRLSQKAEWEGKLQKRLALLGEKGFDEKKIARDVGIKELKAKIKESQVRLRAIDANEKRTAELAAIKAERLAAAEGRGSQIEEEGRAASRRQTQEEKKEEGRRRRASAGLAPSGRLGWKLHPVEMAGVVQEQEDAAGAPVDTPAPRSNSSQWRSGPGRSARFPGHDRGSSGAIRDGRK